MSCVCLVDTRNGCIQVHILYRPSLLEALPDQMPERFGGMLTLALHLDSFFPAVAEVLDALFKTNTEIVCRNAEDASDSSGNPVRVGMNIV